MVTQFHLAEWSPDGCPPTGSLIEMMDLITKSQISTGNRPITIICKYVLFTGFVSLLILYQVITLSYTLAHFKFDRVGQGLDTLSFLCYFSVMVLGGLALSSASIPSWSD